MSDDYAKGLEKWLVGLAKTCRSCPCCNPVPCDGCQQGADCDAMPCRDDCDLYDDCDHADEDDDEVQP